MFKENLQPKLYSINPDLMPLRLGTVIEEFLVPKMPMMPREVLLLVLLSKLAYVMGQNRTQLQSPFIEYGMKYITPRVFAMAFVRSGGGKDALRRTIDNDLLCDVNEAFKERYRIERGKKISEITADADDQFKTKAQKDAYIRSQSPKQFRTYISTGTPEGLENYSKSLEDVGIGGVFYQHNEFTDIFLRKDDKHETILEYLKQMYDGELTVKLLKGEDNVGTISDVVANFLVYSSAQGLETEYAMSRLKDLFGRGYARRAFVCVGNYHTPVPDPNRGSMEYINKRRKNEATIIPQMRGWVNQLYKETKNCMPVTYTKEAEDLLAEYRYYCEKEEVEMGYNTDKAGGTPLALLSEVTGRSWKAFQLASIIGMFEHPDDGVITLSDVEAAIHLTEVYSKHFYSFFNNLSEQSDEVLNMYNYLKARKGKWISMTELRNLSIVGKNRFSKFIETVKDDLVQAAASDGFELKEKEDGRKKLLSVRQPYFTDKKSTEQLMTTARSMHSIGIDEQKIWELLEEENINQGLELDHEELIFIYNKEVKGIVQESNGEEPQKVADDSWGKDEEREVDEYAIYNVMGLDKDG